MKILIIQSKAKYNAGFASISFNIINFFITYFVLSSINDQNFFLIYLISNFGLIIEGLILLVGGNRNNVKLNYIGFFYGLVSFIFVVIFSNYALSWYQTNIENFDLIFIQLIFSISNLSHLISFYVIIISPMVESYYLAIPCININIFLIVIEFFIIIFIYKYRRQELPLSEESPELLELKKIKSVENNQLDIPFNNKNIYSSKSIICPYCGKYNLIGSKTCKFCFKQFPICVICDRLITENDIVYCPFCNSPFHKREFLEWLKIKAYCKNCKKELDLWEFQKFI